MGRDEIYRIAETEHIVSREEWRLPDTSAHTLLVAGEGMGVVRIGGDSYPVSIGKCFYARPGSAVSLIPHFNELTLYRISFERLGRVVNEHGVGIFQPAQDSFAKEGELRSPMPDRMLEMAALLYEAGRQPGAIAGYREQMLLNELLLELTAANMATADGNSTQEAVLRTMDYISANYSKDLSRDKLAGMAKLSPEYYSVLFKQLSGKSLTDFVTDIRIQHVKEALLFSDDRLSDVAKAAGYKDEYYLSRKFKKIVGVSPSVYMKAPKRTVSMNPHLTRHLLALGIVPAATLSFRGMFGEYQEQLDAGQCECRDWMIGFEPDELEQQRPELIICIDNLSADLLRKYRRIAPTLVVPWHASDWRGHLRAIAHAAGKTAAAEDWLEQFHARAEQLRSKLAEAGTSKQTVLVYNIRAESAFVYKNHGMGSHILYNELHLQPPERLRLAPEPLSVAVSPLELLPLYTSDHIVLSVERSDSAERRALEMLTSDPWREWLSNRAHRLHRVDMNRWHGYDSIAAGWQLDDIERLLVLQ